MDDNQTSKNEQLMQAIQQCDYSAAEQALNDGADPNFIDKSRNNITPLRLAFSKRALEIVELLESRGAIRDTKKKPIKNGETTGAASTAKSPPVRPGYFVKRKGTACLGQFYETKLLTLVLLRALRDEKIDQFLLATNLDEAGAFDDLILRYSKEGKERVIFAQAKHVSKKCVHLKDLISEPKGDFSLQKYFESYVKVRKQFEADSKNDIFGGRFEDIDAEFLIFTTATIDFGSSAITVEDCESGRIFATKRSGKFFKITCEELMEEFTTKLKNELAKEQSILDIEDTDVCREVIEDFFSSLIFGIGQSTEDEINELATLVIQASCDTSKSYDLMFLKLHDAVQDWWKQSGEVPLLTKCCDFLENVIRDIDHKPMLENLHAVSVSRLKSCNILFSLEGFENSELFGKVDELVIGSEEEPVFVVSSHPELTALKVVQYLERPESNESFIFINAMHINIESILDALSTISPQFLILSSQGVGIEQMVGKIIKFVNKLLVITDCERDGNYVRDENLGLRDLDHDSQEKILECEVIFQEKPTSLRSLIGNCLELVNTDILSRLITNGTVEISSHPAEDVLQYFVHRTFRHCALKSEILRNDAFHLVLLDRDIKATDDDRDIIVLQSTHPYPTPQRSILPSSIKVTDHIITNVKISISVPRYCSISEVPPAPASVGWTVSEIVVKKSSSMEGHKPKIVAEKNRKPIPLEDDLQAERTVSELLVKKRPAMEGRKPKTDTEKSRKPIPFEDYQQAESYYEQLCEKFPNQNIHLLSESRTKSETNASEQDIEVVWHKTHGSIARLRPFIAEQPKNGFEPRTIDDLQGKVVILAAEPGMGKSTAMTSLAAESISAGCTAWIERINLLNFSQHFDEWEESKKTFERSDVLDFLLIALNHRGSSEEQIARFSESIFKKCCAEKNLILLVDGFDEISPDYKNIVQQLLKILKDSFTATLLVTTRSGGVQLELENCLNTFAHSLSPFSQSDQRTFLRKFWATRLGTSLDESRYRAFSDELFSMLSRSIESRSSDFLSVPLQIKMIALMFEEEFKSFHSTEIDDAVFENNRYKYSNLIQLYDKFMYILIYNVLAEEKTGTDIKMPHNKKNLEIAYRAACKNHMRAAVHVLFNESELKLLLTENDNQNVEKFYEAVRSGEEKTGIVFHNIYGRLLFIHQTYAEYFAALLLAEKFATLSIHNFQAFLEAILVGNLIRGNKTQLCRFLQLKIEESAAKIENKSMKICSLLKALLDEFQQIENVIDDHSSKYLLKIVEQYVSENEEAIPKMLEEESQARKMLLLAVAASMGYNHLSSLICLLVNVNEIYNDYSSLHLAVNGNNLPIINLLIENGASVDIRSPTTDATPLYLAASKGFTEVVQLLLRHGADVNAKKTSDGETILHCAAQHGFLEIAELLIENKANVNARNATSGTTPLRLATEKGSTEMVKLLLKAGADANTRTIRRFRAPLHCAAQEGFSEIVQLLVENGADVDESPLHTGPTPLYNATAGGFKYIVKLLLENGADPNKHTLDDGCTPLYCATKQGLLEIAQLLIEYGANVNDRSLISGESPLSIAAEKGFTALVELLLQSGADVNVCATDDGITPLHWAAQKNFLAIAKLLVENGANVDVCDTFSGATALFYATWNGSREMVDLLMRKGADVNVGIKQDGVTPLHCALRVGFLEIAQLLIENGAKVNEALPTSGTTPLHLAVDKGWEMIVKLLLEKDANVNACNKDDGSTPLHGAAQKGFVKIAELLIENKARVNACKTANGETPLYLAVEKGCKDIAMMLLQNGANPNIYSSNDGTTPLHLAAQSDFLDIAQLLIKFGAKVNLFRTSTGVTPLYLATWEGSLEMVSLLLENGANTSFGRTGDGFTPLHCAVWKNNRNIAKLLIARGANVNGNLFATSAAPLQIAVKKDLKELIDLLLQNGADPNTYTKDDGFTPLHNAAQQGSLYTAKQLIKHKAVVDARNSVGGETPLHLAVENRFKDVAELLLQNDADVNVCGKDDGFTPLHWAAQNGCLEIARLLIEHRAMVDARKTTDGATPLFLAVECGSKEIVKLLLGHGADANAEREGDCYTPLHCAVWKGNREVIQLLIENGANVNNSTALTPLYIAAQKGSEELIKLLLENGADANNGTAGYGFIPLHWAASQGSVDITKLLIEHGADVNVHKIAFGKTPLYIATEKGSAEVVKILLENGADVDMDSTDNGSTPLHLAAQNGFVEIADMLVKKGANVDAWKTTNDATPLHLAAWNGHKEVVKLLLKNGANTNVGYTDERFTPLHCAAQRDFADIAELLIEHGANVQVCSAIDKVTPLNIAENSGHQAVKLILERKARNRTFPRFSSFRRFVPRQLISVFSSSSSGSGKK